ncbi:TPA: helix-turn-helix domain-containing protein, partial [Enterococcus faecium]
DRSIENIKIGARYKIPKKAVIEYILKIQDEGKNHAIIK